MLMYKIFTYKRPLIVIVASKTAKIIKGDIIQQHIDN